MPALLCTLGTSWAVVPEAFLLGNGNAAYDSVTIVTTDSELTRKSLSQVVGWLHEHHPATAVRALAIEGLADLASSEDHSRFEEGLYEAYLAMLREGDRVHVCLAGGFKTMSAAAQEAAGLLGCDKLFHILAEPEETRTTGGRLIRKFPETHLEIISAIKHDRVRVIGLGSRTGWPTIQELASDAPPLPPPGEPFFVEDLKLINAIHHCFDAASRLAASEKDLAKLPFTQLARWSPGDRSALEMALDADKDRVWVRSLPKVELHCHLGGFATHGSLLQQVRSAALHPQQLPECEEPINPPGWPLPVNAIGLENYRHLGDASGSSLLKDPGCLKKHIELLYAHLQQENIHYAEIRCSPGNYSVHGRSPWDVLLEIRDHFATFQQAAMEADEVAPLVNLIIIATRQAGGDFRTPIARHLALAATASEHWTDESKPRVVGVDLAGYENKDTRAHYYRDDFMAALRLGVGITVHAGENDDAEGIWSAILDLNARRLGHALHLAASPTLLKTVADRHIGIEMCPYANLQIIGFPLDDAAREISPAYPLLAYLEAGVSVTVNTDNIGISNAGLTENILLLARICPGIKRHHVLELLRNGIDQAFLSAAVKTALRSIFIPHPIRA